MHMCVQSAQPKSRGSWGMLPENNFFSGNVKIGFVSTSKSAKVNNSSLKIIHHLILYFILFIFLFYYVLFYFILYLGGGKAGLDSIGTVCYEICQKNWLHVC